MKILTYIKNNAESLMNSFGLFGFFQGFLKGTKKLVRSFLTLALGMTLIFVLAGCAKDDDDSSGSDDDDPHFNDPYFNNHYDDDSDSQVTILTLKNETSQPFGKFYISPSSSDDWGDDMLPKTLWPGEKYKFTISDCNKEYDYKSVDFKGRVSIMRRDYVKCGEDFILRVLRFRDRDES